MSRYFFDTGNGTFVRDDEGTEFDGVEAAEAGAIRCATEMACDMLPTTVREKPLRVVVRDLAGNQLLTVRLAVEVIRG